MMNCVCCEILKGFNVKWKVKSKWSSDTVGKIDISKSRIDRSNRWLRVTGIRMPEMRAASNATVDSNLDYSNN